MKTTFDLFFAFFSYAGNGGVACAHPSLRAWFSRTLLSAKGDPRVGAITDQDLTDTPITMTRNAAVRAARRAGADFLVMIDSDQHPDLYLGDPAARPFFESSFDFAAKRKELGLVTVVGAPYCGPPPAENVYVFRWATWESDQPNPDMRLEQYGREEAARMAGIHPAAALPTGLVLFDLAAFDLVRPPYFYYEYTDEEECEKASTEDVTATRDICLAGQERLGYSPVFCNWDAWAGHYKPKCVGKPRVITSEQVNDKYRHAVLAGKPAAERLVRVEAGPVRANGFRAAGGLAITMAPLRPA